MVKMSGWNRHCGLNNKQQAFHRESHLISLKSLILGGYSKSFPASWLFFGNYNLIKASVVPLMHCSIKRKDFKRILVAWSFPGLIREGLLFLSLTGPPHVMFLRKETVHDIWLGLFKHKQHSPSQAVWNVCSLHSQFPFFPPAFSLTFFSKSSSSFLYFLSALRLALHQAARVHWSSLYGFNDMSHPGQLSHTPHFFFLRPRLQIQWRGLSPVCTPTSN